MCRSALVRHTHRAHTQTCSRSTQARPNSLAWLVIYIYICMHRASGLPSTNASSLPAQNGGAYRLRSEQLVGAKPGVHKRIHKGGCEVGSCRVHGRASWRPALHQMGLVDLCTKNNLRFSANQVSAASGMVRASWFLRPGLLGTGFQHRLLRAFVPGLLWRPGCRGQPSGMRALGNVPAVAFSRQCVCSTSVPCWWPAAVASMKCHAGIA